MMTEAAPVDSLPSLAQVLGLNAWPVLLRLVKGIAGQFGVTLRGITIEIPSSDGVLRRYTDGETGTDHAVTRTVDADIVEMVSPVLVVFKSSFGSGPFSNILGRDTFAIGAVRIVYRDSPAKSRESDQSKGYELCIVSNGAKLPLEEHRALEHVRHDLIWKGRIEADDTIEDLQSALAKRPEFKKIEDPIPTGRGVFSVPRFTDPKLLHGRASHRYATFAPSPELAGGMTKRRFMAATAIAVENKLSLFESMDPVYDNHAVMVREHERNREGKGVGKIWAAFEKDFYNASGDSAKDIALRCERARTYGVAPTDTTGYSWRLKK